MRRQLGSAYFKGGCGTKTSEDHCKQIIKKIDDIHQELTELITDHNLMISQELGTMDDKEKQSKENKKGYQKLDPEEYIYQN